MSYQSNNQERSAVYTQSHMGNFHSEPTVSFASQPILASANVGEYRWKHFLTDINPAASRKLTAIGILYILLAVLNIGLEVRVLVQDGFCFFAGFFHGFFLFTVGVLTLVLCQQQVFALTSLYVLTFFQFLFTMITFVVYGLIYYITSETLINCSRWFLRCDLGEFSTTLIVAMIHVFITFIIVTINLTVITNARRAPVLPSTPAYVTYGSPVQTMPVSFQNPCPTPMNTSNTV